MLDEWQRNAKGCALIKKKKLPKVIFLKQKYKIYLELCSIELVSIKHDGDIDSYQNMASPYK